MRERLGLALRSAFDDELRAASPACARVWSPTPASSAPSATTSPRHKPSSTTCSGRITSLLAHIDTLT